MPRRLAGAGGGKRAHTWKNSLSPAVKINCWLHERQGPIMLSPSSSVRGMARAAALCATVSRPASMLRPATPGVVGSRAAALAPHRHAVAALHEEYLLAGAEEELVAAVVAGQVHVLLARQPFGSG
jgi:hypothetical protein